MTALWSGVCNRHAGGVDARLGARAGDDAVPYHARAGRAVACPQPPGGAGHLRRGRRLRLHGGGRYRPAGARRRRGHPRPAEAMPVGTEVVLSPDDWVFVEDPHDDIRNAG